MLGNDYSGQQCSVARSLEVIGERWTLLIIRNIFMGLRRFDEIQANLGIARNVLQARLERLVDAGVLEKRQYSERPPRFEYRLTPQGRDLSPVITTLVRWGDEHRPAPGGPPTLVLHRDCGGEVSRDNVCATCGAHVLDPGGIVTALGPGASENHPLRKRTPA